MYILQDLPCLLICCIAMITVISDPLRRNSSLTSLDLWDNGLRDEGVLVLADALRGNDSLTSLDLGCNKIGNEGCQVLMQCFLSAM